MVVDDDDDVDVDHGCHTNSATSTAMITIARIATPAELPLSRSTMIGSRCPMTFVFPGEGGRKTLMWNLAGLALAFLSSLLAWRKSFAAGGYYDRDLYGMEASAHRRYAAVFLAFAFFFGAAFALHASGAGLIALALYALVAVIYTTSFLRGASEDE